MPLKLATYNIQFGYGQDMAYDLARISQAVTGQDIVCLQEVTKNWQACNNDDQPAIIADALGAYAAYAPGFEVGQTSLGPDGKPDNRPRAFGNMVLSRWPILYSRAHSLPRTPVRPEEVPVGFYPLVDLPRTALETVIDVPGSPLRVFSIHLSHLPGAQRRAQIQALHDLVHLPSARRSSGSPIRAWPILWRAKTHHRFQAKPFSAAISTLSRIILNMHKCASNSPTDGC